jgi:hypothetical protein
MLNLILLWTHEDVKNYYTRFGRLDNLLTILGINGKNVDKWRGIRRPSEGSDLWTVEMLAGG